MKDFKELEIKKLISEYDYLLNEEEWKEEVIEINKSEFLNLVNGTNNPPEAKETHQPKRKINETLFEIDDLSKSKIKKIYYKIAKLTHPDKISDPELNETYKKAAKFYEQNNALELYRIANKLSIKIKVDDMMLNQFKTVIGEKKKYLSSLESSWLWLWVQASTQEEKDNIVKMFLAYSADK
jgi:hypothetical protein